MADIQIIVQETPSSIIQVQEQVVNVQPVNGVTALDQLTDVNIPNPLEGQVLVRESGVWVARTFNASDVNQEFVQASASALWTINHNLNKYPSVSIVDSANDEVEGTVRHVSKNQLTISFSAAFSGRAFLN